MSYNYSALSQPEHQCGYYTPFYIVLGPFGLNIRSEADPITGKIVAWKIGGWIDRDITTIWMDGRPHPPRDAFHSYGGFTTGVWEGDTLTTYTTHIKANYLRRNGTPTSDRATMRTHMVRHGDLLTITAIFDDPIYLSEPHVYSQSWKLDPRLNLPPTASPCEPIAELPSDAAAVPHYLPGQNPFINEMPQMYNIPLEAVLGGAETRYPEFRQKLKGYVAPAICVRYCCGPGQPPGQRCIIDGSGRPTLPPQQ